MVNSSSKTLIFSSMILPNIISGNLTTTLSEHLPRPFIAPNIFLNSSTPRSDKYERDLIKKTLFLIIVQLVGIIWLASNMNVDNLFKNFIEKFDSLLNTFEKISTNKLNIALK